MDILDGRSGKLKSRIDGECRPYIELLETTVVD